MAHEAHKAEIVIMVRDLVTGEVRRVDIPQAANLTMEDVYEEFESIRPLDVLSQPRIFRTSLSYRPERREDLKYHTLIRDRGVSERSICDLP